MLTCGFSTRYQAEQRILGWHHVMKRWNVSMLPYQGTASLCQVLFEALIQSWSFFPSVSGATVSGEKSPSPLPGEPTVRHGLKTDPWLWGCSPTKTCFASDQSCCFSSCVWRCPNSHYTITNVPTVCTVCICSAANAHFNLAKFFHWFMKSLQMRQTIILWCMC